MQKLNCIQKGAIKCLVKRGYTEAEALAHVTNPANQVPADFGPDWIDSPETIHQHFEEQGMIKKQNYEL